MFDGDSNGFDRLNWWSRRSGNKSWLSVARQKYAKSEDRSQSGTLARIRKPELGKRLDKV